MFRNFPLDFRSDSICRRSAAVPARPAAAAPQREGCGRQSENGV